MLRVALLKDGPHGRCLRVVLLTGGPRGRSQRCSQQDVDGISIRAVSVASAAEVLRHFLEERRTGAMGTRPH